MPIQFFENGNIKWRKEGKKYYWHDFQFYVVVTPNSWAFYKPNAAYAEKRKKHEPRKLSALDGPGRALYVRITYFLRKREILPNEEIGHWIELAEMFNTNLDDLTESVRTRIKDITNRVNTQFVPLGYIQDFPDIPAYDEENLTPQEITDILNDDEDDEGEEWKKK